MCPPNSRSELIERSAAQNLLDYVQAFQRVAPAIRATSISVAGGVAAYTGPGSPLTTVKGIGPSIRERDLDEIERFFGKHEYTIEAAPWLDEKSLRLLADRGYKPSATEHVVIREWQELTLEPHSQVGVLAPSPWSGLMRRGFELPDESPWRELTSAAAHREGATNLALPGPNGNWFACAQLAPCAGLWILGCDATLPEHRGQGAQTALIHQRLHIIPRAGLAVAEVAPGSASERNYLRCGFKLAHARTHFRR